MNTAVKTFRWALILASASGAVLAQQPAPQTPAAPATSAPAAKPSAQSDAGEPRANSMPSPGDTPGPGTSASPTPAASAPVAGRTASKTAPSSRGQGGARDAAGGQKGPAAADRLNLNTATVTGDREQPKVMYIVPWKGSNIGDLSGKPMNSLLDEALAPVDREEFKREVAYYDALQAGAPQNGAAPPAAKPR